MGGVGPKGHFLWESLSSRGPNFTSLPVVLPLQNSALPLNGALTGQLPESLLTNPWSLLGMGWG